VANQLRLQSDKSGNSEVTVALQGTLDTFALPDVLRLLASTKKTGRLLITGNRGSGSVWVDAGSVVGSEASGAEGEQEDVDVLFELLRYAEGAFTFEAGTTAPSPHASRAVEPLLVDAERQLAEWREIEAVVPSMEAWVSLVSELSEPEILIAAEKWKTIVAIGSGTSVSGIGSALDLGELPVCRLVKELVELGLVNVSTTPMPTLRPIDMPSTAAVPSNGNGNSSSGDTAATWDPFAIEIPGVEPVANATDAVEGAVATDATAAAGTDGEGDGAGEAPPVVSVVDDAREMADDEEVAADEVAKQLASLSPKAARAVAAAAQAETEEERDAALAEASDEDDEPINRGLLLKFLSSVKS
jgi:hypothetical protein